MAFAEVFDVMDDRVSVRRYSLIGWAAREVR